MPLGHVRLWVWLDQNKDVKNNPYSSGGNMLFIVSSVVCRTDFFLFLVVLRPIRPINVAAAAAAAQAPVEEE